jgi:hypothetical protein
VTARDGPALALIIDHDVGFLMWLGEVFAALGWQSVPALHCRQAMALAKRFDLTIGTLVINPELRGAKRLLDRLADTNPGLRVVLICDAPASCADPDPGNAHSRGIRTCSLLERPAPGEPVSRIEWVRKIRRMLP